MPRKRRNWNASAAARRASFRKFGKYAGNFALGTAETALKYALKASSLLNVERKYFDTTAVVSGIDATADVNCVTNIAQGTTVTTRIGNSVKATSFNFRASMDFVDDDSNLAMVRIMIIRDLDSRLNTSPVIANILQHVANQYEMINSPLNLQFGGSFQCLFDKVYTHNTASPNKFISFNYKFNGLTKQIHKVSRKCDPKITWNSGTATDYNFGHIYVVAVSNVVTGTTTPNLSYIFRLRFIDN